MEIRDIQSKCLLKENETTRIQRISVFICIKIVWSDFLYSVKITGCIDYQLTEFFNDIIKCIF